MDVHILPNSKLWVLCQRDKYDANKNNEVLHGWLLVRDCMWLGGMWFIASGRPPEETGTTTTSPATVHVTSTRRTRWRPRWLDFQLVCLFPKNHDYFTVLRRVYTRLIAAKGSSTQSPCTRTLERRICFWHGLWRRYFTTRKRRNTLAGQRLPKQPDRRTPIRNKIHRKSVSA